MKKFFGTIYVTSKKYWIGDLFFLLIYIMSFIVLCSFFAIIYPYIAFNGFKEKTDLYFMSNIRRDAFEELESGSVVGEISGNWFFYADGYEKSMSATQIDFGVASSVNVPLNSGKWFEKNGENQVVLSNFFKKQYKLNCSYDFELSNYGIIEDGANPVMITQKINAKVVGFLNDYNYTFDEKTIGGGNLLSLVSTKNSAMFCVAKVTQVCGIADKNLNVLTSALISKTEHNQSVFKKYDLDDYATKTLADDFETYRLNNDANSIILLYCFVGLIGVTIISLSNRLLFGKLKREKLYAVTCLVGANQKQLILIDFIKSVTVLAFSCIISFLVMNNRFVFGMEFLGVKLLNSSSFGLSFLALFLVEFASLIFNSIRILKINVIKTLNRKFG